MTENSKIYVYVNVNYAQVRAVSQCKTFYQWVVMSAKQQSSYSISDLAREFEITTRAIRFYEDQGLLAPSRIGQTRVYSARDRTLLKLILRGKRLGFSLAESRRLFELYDPVTGNQCQLEQYLSMLEEKEHQLEQQMLDIQHMRQELGRARQRCLNALQQAKTT